MYHCTAMERSVNLHILRANNSPLDVEGIDIGIMASEIVDVLLEARERKLVAILYIKPRPALEEGDTEPSL